MKSIRFGMLIIFIFVNACSNLPPDDADIIKAYPNPYNPTQGNLTIERIDGSNFATNTQYDLVISDYNLQEVYRANVAPDTGNLKKIYWGGIDASGVKVSPGVYYLKLMITGQSGTSNTESMFKLVVQ